MKTLGVLSNIFIYCWYFALKAQSLISVPYLRTIHELFDFAPNNLNEDTRVIGRWSDLDVNNLD